MERLFAVTVLRGPAWDPSRSMEEQSQWTAHATYMDSLAAERFVLIGGPLEGSSEVLLIFRAHEAEQIISQLEADPWHRRALLKIGRVLPWTLRLGSLG
jgi:uncharacterized protein YciI